MSGRLSVSAPGAGLPALLAVAAILGLSLALCPGELAPTALRAAAVVGALGAVAVLLARRSRVRPAPGRRLTVLARHPLSRDAGIALIELEGQPLLLGFGSGGVRVLERTVTPGAARASASTPDPEPAP